MTSLVSFTGTIFMVRTVTIFSTGTFWYSVVVTSMVAGAQVATGVVSQPVSQAFFLPNALALPARMVPAARAKTQPVIFLTIIEVIPERGERNLSGNIHSVRRTVTTDRITPLTSLERLAGISKVCG